MIPCMTYMYSIKKTIDYPSLSKSNDSTTYIILLTLFIITKRTIVNCNIEMVQFTNVRMH